MRKGGAERGYEDEPAEVLAVGVIVGGLVIVSGAGGRGKYLGVEQGGGGGACAVHVAWLPGEATDICFYKSRGFTAAEFRISEADFVEMVPGEGVCAFADRGGAV